MSIGLLAAIGCVAVFVGIVGGMEGQHAALRYGLAFGFLVFIIATFGVLKHSGGRDATHGVPIESGRRSATEIRQSRRLWAVLVAMTMCCTVLTAGPATPGTR